MNTSDMPVFTKKGATMPIPCPEWADKLAVGHRDDLSSAERGALNAHIATCTACAAVRDEYRAMDASILSLPVVAPLPQQAMQPVRLEETPGEQTEAVPVSRRPLPSRSRRRMSRVARVCSAVAAVLVVGIIVGGFALLASSSRTRTATGTAASPAVYVATDISYSVAYAINGRTGAILWRHTIGHKLSVYPIATNGLMIFASYDGYLYAFHTNDGTSAWQKRVGNGVNGFAVLGDARSVSNGVLYFSTTDAHFIALRVSDGAILWNKQISRLHHTTTITQNGNTYTSKSVLASSCANGCMTQVMQVSQGVVYAYDDGLYAVKASDGSVIWRDPAFSFNGQSFAVVDGKVFAPAPSNGNDIAVLQASDGKLLHTISGFTRGQPMNFTVADSVLYVLDLDQGLYAYRISDYSLLWHKSTNPCVGFDMTVSDGSIYTSFNGAISNSSGSITDVCAFRTSDGSLRWQWRKTDNEGVTQPVVLDGVLYLAHNTADQKNYVEAWSASDGHVLWRVPFASLSLQGPVVG